MSGGSITWSSTEIRTCCRSRGAGSGSSAIPDDYRRFSAAVNAIYAMNAKIGPPQAEQSLRQRDRAFGAVLLGVGGLCFELTGDILDQHDRVSDVVGVED